MELNCRRASRLIRMYLLSSVAVFASALAYYVLLRTQLPWPGYLLELEHGAFAHLGDLSRGTYPSFAFSLAMGLLSIALFKLDRVHASIAIFSVWTVGLLHEVTLGTFSQLDVVAGSLGALVPLILVLTSRHAVVIRQQPTNKFDFSQRLKFCSLILVSATMATATSEYEPIESSNCTQFDENGTCVARSTLASPVYMSYQDLRSAVKMTDPRELTSVSRIYLYQSMLFINERNEGIHVIDNRFPATPERIGFIEIPGNTEISIREDNLYADSYIDLVTLDLSNIENVTEIARQESIFPYNARQNIPGNIRLSGIIESERGVVVGYQ